MTRSGCSRGAELSGASHRLAPVFIAFEGGDGAGKTTQIQLLRDRLVAAGREVVLTREPGGTPLGQQIREVLLHGDHVAPRAEALLFAADRAHHVATVVRPALERGATVLQDRYMDSSIAYQGAGRELDPAEIKGLSLWATEELLPDLTVLLDVTPELGRARRGEVHDRLEQEADDFHARVREHYLALAADDPGRYLVVDAGLPAQEIAARVAKEVQL
nr:dTMP kinase [Flexivirga meconopsidis]